MECSIRGNFNEALLARVRDVVGGLGYRNTVAVCGDTRPSTPILKQYVISILLQNGNRVHDLGIGPTPYLSYYTKLHNCLGIMITASHNPETDNGIKIFFDGVEGAGSSPVLDETYKSAGYIIGESTTKVDFSNEYLHKLLHSVDTSAIAKKRPKIIVDCANGTAGSYTPLLLRAAGAHVVTVNAEHSNPFSRESEPTYKSVGWYLPRLVAEMDAAFAVAHDADADRCRIITSDGLMNQDVQLLMMASYLCKRGDTFVTTIEASQLVVDEMRKSGLNVEITRVGSNYVGRRMREVHAVFGGEPCGEYIFPSLTHSADGVFTALMFTKLYCEVGFRSYTPYETLRGWVEVSPREDVERMMERVRDEIERKLGIAEFNTLDGLLFTYDGTKVLIRKSNTQHIIRITCEHKNKSNAQHVYNTIKDIVSACV